MKILIIGHYGGKNFGDEIMLYSLLSQLIEKGFKDIYVVSKPRNQLYFSDKGVKYIVPSLKQTLQKILVADVVLIGGGTHFHDGYNTTRLRKHIIYLLKLLSVLLIGKFKGKKIIQSGVGFGPFYGEWVKKLASVSIKLSDKVMVRDNTSFQNLKGIGIKSPKVRIAFDLAALYPAFRRNGDKLEKISNCIGVSLTSLKYNEYAKSDNFWRECFFKKFRETYKSSNITVKLFVFRGGDRESDLPLSECFYRELKELDPERVQLIQFTEEVETFIEELKTCNKFIATRYHSAVLGYLSQCDLLVIPYHQKLESLARDIKLPESSVFKFYSDSCSELEERLNEFLTSNEKGKYRAKVAVEESMMASTKNLIGLDKN